jgi:hypothetical protein
VWSASTLGAVVPAVYSNGTQVYSVLISEPQMDSFFGGAAGEADADLIRRWFDGGECN